MVKRKEGKEEGGRGAQTRVGREGRRRAGGKGESEERVQRLSCTPFLPVAGTTKDLEPLSFPHDTLNLKPWSPALLFYAKAPVLSPPVLCMRKSWLWCRLCPCNVHGLSSTCAGLFPCMYMICPLCAPYMPLVSAGPVRDTCRVEEQSGSPASWETADCSTALDAIVTGLSPSWKERIRKKQTDGWEWIKQPRKRRSEEEWGSWP